MNCPFGWNGWIVWGTFWGTWVLGLSAIVTAAAILVLHGIEELWTKLKE